MSYSCPSSKFSLFKNIRIIEMIQNRVLGEEHCFILGQSTRSVYVEIGGPSKPRATHLTLPPNQEKNKKRKKIRQTLLSHPSCEAERLSISAHRTHALMRMASSSPVPKWVPGRCPHCSGPDYGTWYYQCESIHPMDT